MTRTVLVIPGAAPQWIIGHARHVAHGLAATGRVLVAFTHARSRSTLPGQPAVASVLGHSAEGYPLWTARFAAAVGLRRTRTTSIIVLWAQANHALALWTSLVARLRDERLIVEVVDVNRRRLSPIRRWLRRATLAIADVVVTIDHGIDPAEPVRHAVAVCGTDRALAQLIVDAFDAMSTALAAQWRLTVHLEPDAGSLTGERRHAPPCATASRAPTDADLYDADVVIAGYDAPAAALVRRAVLIGGTGILVGDPIARRVARSHDGVWLARRDNASILVAVEASAGEISNQGPPAARLRTLAHQVIDVAAPRLRPTAGPGG